MCDRERMVMPARVSGKRSNKMLAAVHGGDVDEVARVYGVSTDRLIDFSANINPIGPPMRALSRLAREAADRDLLTRYPDPDYTELRHTLAAALHVPATAVTVANGSVALIGAIIRAIAPRVCLLATPAFAEYPRALRASGCRVRRVPLDAARGFELDSDALIDVLTKERPAMCTLTNPHNPSGALTRRPQMLRVLERAVRTKTHLVVDEAFMDYVPAETLLADAARSERLVVLRSLTKFYGMPALRVGYAVSTPRMAVRIAAQLPPWPVTTAAASAAAEAVQDHEYARRTVVSNAEQRRWLSQALGTIGVTVYPSAANFVLLRLPATAPTSTQLRARLIADAGVIVRDCRSFDGLSSGRYLRIAVRQRDENERLVRALGSMLKEVTRAR
jgi:threonine-phosphate decarboxylase